MLGEASWFVLLKGQEKYGHHLRYRTAVGQTLGKALTIISESDFKILKK